MGDQLAEKNGHPDRTSKICPVLLYVVSMDVLSLYPSGGNHRSYQWRVLLTQPVVTLRMFGDLGIRQDHDVEATNLYRPDGLRDPKSPSVAEVESPNGYSLGAWNPVVQWRRR